MNESKLTILCCKNIDEDTASYIKQLDNFNFISNFSLHKIDKNILASSDIIAFFPNSSREIIQYLCIISDTLLSRTLMCLDYDMFVSYEALFPKLRHVITYNKNNQDYSDIINFLIDFYGPGDMVIDNESDSIIDILSNLSAEKYTNLIYCTGASEDINNILPTKLANINNKQNAYVYIYGDVNLLSVDDVITPISDSLSDLSINFAAKYCDDTPNNLNVSIFM